MKESNDLKCGYIGCDNEPDKKIIFDDGSEASICNYHFERFMPAKLRKKEYGNIDSDVKWEEWERPFVLAVDVDGILFEYEEWRGTKHFGDLKVEAKHMIDSLRSLHENLVVVIWSCRPDDDILREKLDECKIYYDYINNHPWEPVGISRKMAYDALIDDRAFNDWDDILNIVEEDMNERKNN